jgi:hypothetical protein
MSLIVVEKPASKVVMKLAISKSLAEQFEQELEIFTNNSKHEKLNFDKFAIKLISELRKINKLKNSALKEQDWAREITDTNHKKYA